MHQLRPRRNDPAAVMQTVEPKITEGWGVFENCDDGCVHIAPLFGRRHVTTAGCWCLPHLDAEDRRIIHHHEEGC